LEQYKQDLDIVVKKRGNVNAVVVSRERFDYLYPGARSAFDAWANSVNRGDDPFDACMELQRRRMAPGGVFLLALAALNEKQNKHYEGALCLLCHSLLTGSDLVAVPCDNLFMSCFQEKLCFIAVNNPYDRPQAVLTCSQYLVHKWSDRPSNGPHYAELLETLALYGKNAHLLDYLSTYTDGLALGQLFDRSKGMFSNLQDVAVTLSTISGVRVALGHVRLLAAHYGMGRVSPSPLTKPPIVVLTCDDHEGGMMPTAVSPLLWYDGVVNLVIGGDLVGYLTPDGKPGKPGETLGRKYVMSVWDHLTRNSNRVVMLYAPGHRELLELDQALLASDVSSASSHRPGSIFYPVDVEHSTSSVLKPGLLVAGWCRTRANGNHREVGSWSVDDVVKRLVGEVGALLKQSPAGRLTFILSCHTDVEIWQNLLPRLSDALSCAYRNALRRICFKCLVGHDHKQAPKFDSNVVGLFEIVAPRRNSAVVPLEGGGRLELTVA
jgi:hypothetical protein